MTERCAWCEKRRKLRGSQVCDECAAEHWFQIDGDLWLQDLRQYGSATFPVHHVQEIPTGAQADAWRVALVVEYDWDNASLEVTPLWDSPPLRGTRLERARERRARRASRPT